MRLRHDSAHARAARLPLCAPRVQAYYVWYCPGSILALWVMERFGLRVSLLAGFASQVVMITMSVTGVHLPDPHVAYIVVWVGQARSLRAASAGASARAATPATDRRRLTRRRLQVVGSFGQPLFLNNVVRTQAACAARICSLQPAERATFVTRRLASRETGSPSTSATWLSRSPLWRARSA